MPLVCQANRVEPPNSHCELTCGRCAKRPIGKAVSIVTILTIINRFLSAGARDLLIRACPAPATHTVLSLQHCLQMNQSQPLKTYFMSFP